MNPDAPGTSSNVPVTADVRDNALVCEAAHTIYEAFVNYNNNFRRITGRARKRFETRDWDGAERDLGERIELYTKSVARTIAALSRLLGHEQTNRALWHSLKEYFGERVNDIPDGEFSKTYFNSINRRIFNTVGIDPEIEFVALRLETEEQHRHLIKHRRYLNWISFPDIVDNIMTDFAFDAEFADPAADREFIIREIAAYATSHDLQVGSVLRIEFVQPVFYQSSRAYLVGKIFWPGLSAPLIIALKHTVEGIAVDAVLMSGGEVSILFGFTRSYFFVDVEPVEGAVYFLKSILPQKPLDELYTVLGRVRQGKTERYRTLTRHLRRTQDQFIHARGAPGLVMLVFTLPGYDVVFKIMRDKFGYPKNVSHEQVMNKYQFVFKHDRAGRLIDTQEFRNLKLPANRFEAGLLDELLTGAAGTIHLDGADLVLNHVYIERRVRPLNLYVREASAEAARAAILDYGTAIKDLAETNIFPGDLLLKNFGVTASGRVVFYDYDEVALVTECRFRELPEVDDDYGLMDPGTHIYIAPNDIFPEEFIKFLAMDAELRGAFMQVHGDLLTPAYWRDVKNRRLAGEITQVIPYERPRLPATAA